MSFSLSPGFRRAGIKKTTAEKKPVNGLERVPNKALLRAASDSKMQHGFVRPRALAPESLRNGLSSELSLGACLPKRGG